MFDLPATDRPVESGTMKIRIPETDSKKASENLPFQKGHEYIPTKSSFRCQLLLLVSGKGAVIPYNACHVL